MCALSQNPPHTVASGLQETVVSPSSACGLPRTSSPESKGPTLCVNTSWAPADLRREVLAVLCLSQPATEVPEEVAGALTPGCLILEIITKNQVSLAKGRRKLKIPNHGLWGLVRSNHAGLFP